LSDLFSNNSNAPDIHFTTIANKLNFNEIPDLITNCANAFSPKIHEIRDFSLLEHSWDWGIKHKLKQEEWKSLTNNLSEISADYIINPYPGIIISDTQKTIENLYFLDKQSGFRIYADGKICFLNSNDSIDIRYIDNPLSFFRDMSRFVNMDILKTKELRKISGELIKKILVTTSADNNIKYCVDEVTFDSISVMFQGWCFGEKGKKVYSYFFFPGQEKIQVEFTPTESPDVEKVYGEKASKCRFKFYVPLDNKYTPWDFKDMKLEFTSQA